MLSLFFAENKMIIIENHCKILQLSIWDKGNGIIKWRHLVTTSLLQYICIIIHAGYFTNPFPSLPTSGPEGSDHAREGHSLCGVHTVKPRWKMLS